MKSVYQPKKIESKIYKMWEEKKYFTPQIDAQKKPFVIIMPPANANSSLHIGNAVFVTLEDIMVRYHRMKGEPTLWLPGADHAGIMTQVVYERELAKKGKTRFDLGRENFFQEVYKFTLKNKKRIENQLKKLGASCDWSRKRFTLEPEITKSVYFTFKKMYGEGLIYRGERIINWCPHCQTALSDLEVKYKEVKGKLYYVKYPIVGSKEFVTVATTRPETMLGDTAVAVHPSDKRYRNLFKKPVLLKLPLTKREIPLIFDQEVDPEFGTGALKITPAHDPLDFEIGQRHKLPIIKVINQEAKMTRQAGKEYASLGINDCRKKIIQDLEKQNLLVKEKDYQHSIGFCERCGSMIEPLVSKQWFLKTKKLAEEAMRAVKQKKIQFIPDYFEKIYFHWLENIKDWCLSRQIWWGQRLPVWYCECGETIVEVETPKKCPKCKGNKLRQDKDTLDTWFSSGQWPFTVFGWPKKTKDFKYFYPTQVIETGWDILFFWVARMMMLGLYCTKKTPFRYVYLHGLVRDKDWQKMSKSKGNVIDPLGVVDLYGADALRMALVFGTGAGRDLVISEEKIKGQRHFTNKIWNAARFILTNLKGKDDFLKVKPKCFTQEDEWIISELKKTVKKINLSFEKFNFHQAAEEIYSFFWHKFCDETIEDVKKRLYDESNSSENKLAGRWILYRVLITSLKLLHPFMPFVTEELYQKLPGHPKEALIIEDWPEEEKILRD